MYKPTRKTLEKLGFIENTLKYNELAQSDFLCYEEGKINACVGSEGCGLENQIDVKGNLIK